MQQQTKSIHQLRSPQVKDSSVAEGTTIPNSDFGSLSFSSVKGVREGDVSEARELQANKEPLAISPRVEHQHTSVLRTIERSHNKLHSLYDAVQSKENSLRKSAWQGGMGSSLYRAVVGMQLRSDMKALEYFSRKLEQAATARFAAFDRFVELHAGKEVSAAQRSESTMLRDFSFPAEKARTLYTFQDLLMVTNPQRIDQNTQDWQCGVTWFYGTGATEGIRDQLRIEDAGLGIVRLELYRGHEAADLGQLYSDDALAVIKEFKARGTVDQESVPSYTGFVVQDPFRFSVFRKAAAERAKQTGEGEAPVTDLGSRKPVRVELGRH